ncbi:MAG: hypothetical protein INQ03_02645 [Candidatus Heimdallarchaeota archaeon]|nr:hypothetical protein [Candidatus Heimdallarchaeota archaeon]
MNKLILGTTTISIVLITIFFLVKNPVIFAFGYFLFVYPFFYLLNWIIKLGSDKITSYNFDIIPTKESKSIRIKNVLILISIFIISLIAYLTFYLVLFIFLLFGEIIIEKLNRSPAEILASIIIIFYSMKLIIEIKTDLDQTGFVLLLSKVQESKTISLNDLSLILGKNKVVIFDYVYKYLREYPDIIEFNPETRVIMKKRMETANEIQRYLKLVRSKKLIPIID